MIGIKNQTRKLTLDDVRTMREAYQDGATQGSLAKYFGVSVGQVGRIVRGESWMEAGRAPTPTQAIIDRSMAKVLGMLEAEAEKDKLPPAPPPAPRVPPSPLDEEGEAPEAADEPAGLTALQKRAASFGMDIEKLLKEGD